MNRLKSNDLIKIYGGDSLISSALLNAITKGLDALLEIGRSIGSAIRRMYDKNLCP